MPKTFAHARMLPFPTGASPARGHIQVLHRQQHGTRTDLLMEYQELRLTAPPRLSEQQGKLYEHLQGEWVPRRLRFSGVEMEWHEWCAQLDTLPQDHPAREIVDFLCFRATQGDNYYIFSIHGPEHPDLLLTARQCRAEPHPGPVTPVTLTRDWSPSPLCPPMLVPNPRQLHQRFGGDPVEVCLDGHRYSRRLFVGGLGHQSEQRPDVGAVLTLCHDAPRWAVSNPPHPADRWNPQGEGYQGMDASHLAAEAEWVTERLRAGQRVLVHCTSAMNRSVSVCCAVLIVLEGLSAEAALERVRQHHPWSRPDPCHWLAQSRGISPD